LRSPATITWLAALGCVAPQTGGSTDTAPADTALEQDTQGGDTQTSDTDVPVSGPCPVSMVHINDVTSPYCVDQYEAFITGHSPYEVPETGAGAATSSSGQVPQGYISAVVAADACETAEKRLCTLNEWMRACQGPQGNLYPYGDTYDANACNDTRGSHPINDLWGDDPNRWDGEHMNDPGLNQLPDSLSASGAHPDCVSDYGVFDLHGNLHEWIDDPNGTFKGGFYVDAVINGAGCTYTTTAHSVWHHDYSTGFRCCADPTEDQL